VVLTLQILIYENGGKHQMEGIPGKTVSQMIRENGFHLDMPCNGKGTCGKCRVKASGALSEPSDRERELLGEEALKEGIRLACMTTILGDCEIRLSEESSQIVSDGYLPDFAYRPIGVRYGFAVDVGTTTVAVYFFDFAEGKELGRDSFKNPQGVFGADVVSRIEASLKGEEKKLSELILKALSDSFSKLCEENGIDRTEADTAVITGNTTMLYLLSRVSAEPLSHAPFEIETLFGEFWEKSSLFPQFPSMKVYFPRTISAFVGSDITCSILSSGLLEETGEEGKVSLMIDIGTNGEMAVYGKDSKLCCCSTAAGPAFEGAGITMGMGAQPGAVNRVWTEENQIFYSTVGDAGAKGICGSGLIDAVSVLLQTGLVDESGCIDEENEAYADYLTEYQDEPAVKIGDSGVILTQKDIREIQLAKAAICAGIYSLLNAVEKTPEEVEHLILAGGFGSFINCENAGKMGLIPKELSSKTHSVGNAAGMGAVMILLSEESFQKSLAVAQDAETLDLSTSAFFMDQYVECMMFDPAAFSC
jgi:uncharacterized 2Fe-2S/4Fe-4S cluster protein (DUF4445 family)